MKIIIRNDVITGGGVENVLFNLASYLQANGHEVTVIVDHGRRDVFYANYDRRIHFITVHRFRRFRRRSLKGIAKRIIDQAYQWTYRIRSRFFLKCDVAIAIKEGACMIDMVQLRAKKRVGWVHVDYDYTRWTQWTFHSNEEELACMKKFDNIVCVSNAVRESVLRTVGDPGNLCVLYNPVHCSLIRRQAEAFSLDNRPARFLFVSIGRLDEQKQYPLLLDVVKTLSGSSDFEVWILGGGDQRRALQEQIDRLKLKNVTLMGQVSNPYPYLAAADCFVSSSLWESYGLAIQEAFVLGVPVVVTECPSIREVVDPDCGTIVENSYEGLLNGMRKMLESPDILREMRENIAKRGFSDKELYEDKMRDICALLEE